MKKLFFSVLAFVICLNLQGQEISNLSRQSPNTFQFTKYGEVNVNESTGVINVIKIAKSTAWVGIHWNLIPSDVITRQVKNLYTSW
jgi:hypothetical protein